MKNQQIKNLLQPVPEEIRLQVYKEALEFYKEDSSIVYQSTIGKRPRGLCMLLPLVLWGEEAFYNDDNWYWKETKIAFPELSEVIIKHINNTKLNDQPKLRQFYLLRFIKKLSSNE